MTNELTYHIENLRKHDNHQQYHNSDHCLSVLNRCLENPLYNQLDERTQIQLQLAAIYHDAGHNATKTEGENLTEACRIFAKANNNFDLTVEEQSDVKDLIWSTHNEFLGRDCFKFRNPVIKTASHILRDADITQTTGPDIDRWMKALSDETNTQITLESTKAFYRNVAQPFTNYGRALIHDVLSR